MTDAAQAPPGAGPAPAHGRAESLTVPIIVYILYGVGFFVPPAALVGIIMAHTGMSNAGAISGSHFAYQTRTFWYGLLMLAVATALGISYAMVNFVAAMYSGSGEFTLSEGVPPALILSGAIFFWWFVWTLVRCIKGFVTVLSRRKMPKPGTLLW
jgi:uncharacterized membrane protein